MRVLIVGAGVAGLTLAARLAQQGRRAVLVERAEIGEDGYALGLYPFGTSVLHGLGGYDRLLSEGIVTGRYELADHEGQIIQALFWGRGWFFGVYPALGRVMCVCGGPAADRAWSGPTAPVEMLLDRLQPLPERLPSVRQALAALGDATGVYRWPMRDTRSQGWVAGRVALCGDAAASFLPTAGVGASNAMRAAAGLADELSRAGAATVPLALELYEQRCRQTVERNQTESRRLARAMFVQRPAVGWLRDQVARHYPAERMLAQIIARAHQPF